MFFAFRNLRHLQISSAWNLLRKVTWQWSKFDLLRLHPNLFRSLRTISNLSLQCPSCGWLLSGCLLALRAQRSLPPPFTAVHSPDSTTDRSPSLLPHVQRFKQEAFMNKAKRKKEECELTTQQGKQEDEMRAASSSFSRPILKEPPEVRPAEDLPVWFVPLLNSTCFTTILSTCPVSKKDNPAKSRCFLCKCNFESFRCFWWWKERRTSEGAECLASTAQRKRQWALCYNWSSNTASVYIENWSFLKRKRRGHVEPWPCTRLVHVRQWDDNRWGTACVI